MTKINKNTKDLQSKTRLGTLPHSTMTQVTLLEENRTKVNHQVTRSNHHYEQESLDYKRGQYRDTRTPRLHRSSTISSSLPEEHLCMMKCTSRDYSNNIPDFKLLYRNPGRWLIPFETSVLNKHATIRMELEGKPVLACVDTGSTRVAVSSRYILEHFGQHIMKNLRNYRIGTVKDAQGETVPILGFYYATFNFPGKLKVKYPIMVFHSKTSDLLIGLQFLQAVDIAILPRRGLLNYHQDRDKLYDQDKDKLCRMNYDKPNIPCLAKEDFTVLPEQIVTIPAMLQFKENQSELQNEIVGKQVLTSSEQLEPEVDVTHLQCLPTFSLVQPDYSVVMVIDNTRSQLPMNLKRGDMMGHAEFLHPISKHDEEKLDKLVTDFLQDGPQYQDAHTVDIPVNKNAHYLTDENVERFDYVKSVDIATKDLEIIKWSKDLLIRTEACWSKHHFDMGAFYREAHFELQPDSKPHFEKQRPVHPQKYDQANLILSQMEKFNIIARQNSSYSAAPVWVWKSLPHLEGGQSGELDHAAARQLRLAIDYRKLNSQIISRCHYPNPTVDFILNRFSDARCMSALDLTNSFFQIKLSETAKQYTGFTACNAQYVFKRLPQGLTISSAILAECLAEVINECKLSQYCISYADNIFVVSKSVEEHKKHLESVLEALIKYNLKLHPAKSSIFVTTKCRIFGFEINLTEGTISIDPSRVTPLLQLHPPTNKKQLRHIIGSVSYYKKICPYLGYYLAPLHAMTGAKSTFQWTKGHEKAFKMMKREISKLPYVHMPNFSIPFHVFTDAAMGSGCSYHISQFYMQKKIFVPLSWGSHKFSTTESSYSQVVAELFGIVYALASNPYLLQWSKVFLHTDAKPLSYLLKFKQSQTKLNRWYLFLQNFDLQIIWEPASTIGIKLSDMFTRQFDGKKAVNRKITKEEENALPEITFTKQESTSFEQAEQMIKSKLDEKIKFVDIDDHHISDDTCSDSQ